MEIKTYSIPVIKSDETLNTIDCSVIYNNHKYILRLLALKRTHKNGLVYDEYEPLSTSHTRRFFLFETGRRSKKQDARAEALADKYAAAALPELLEDIGAELAVKESCYKFSCENIDKLAAYFEQEYRTRFFLNPDSLEINTVSGWMQYFLDNYDDEAVVDYKGDASTWFADCIRFDTVRPKQAAVLIDVPTENGVKVPALVDVFGTDEQAERFCEWNGWTFDDCFTSYKGLFKSPALWVDDMNNSVLPDDFYTNPDNWYSSKEFEPYLYA